MAWAEALWTGCEPQRERSSAAIPLMESADVGIFSAHLSRHEFAVWHCFQAGYC